MLSIFLVFDLQMIFLFKLPKVENAKLRTERHISNCSSVYYLYLTSINTNSWMINYYVAKKQNVSKFRDMVAFR